ncbi:non-ribosomal peptide synthetase [Tahibacter harae]|uniref:Amino acid adenylation domain-containing protein n=1 Tax=Tahibacter harae TaxID=2963937 RepID=A0ABT1QM46_9GAMM|nr:amino acid adenylation domain-containing protein [Tahibacter harae]MCQ4163606.1 amino acid adenylation domain-containing protein [Tahibacter harae]
MDARSLVAQALEAGVALYLQDGRLAFKARKGEFPEALKAAIRAHKGAIEQHLAALQDEDASAAATPPLRALGLERARLSFAQERLWALDRLGGGSSHYNLPFAIELRGDCRADLLEAAIRRIVQRHAALRTNFFDDGSAPYQQAGDAARFVLERVDHLAALAPAQREQELAARIEAEAAHVFDLRHDLLLRASLLRLAPDRHVLLVNMHHIASDGWSIGLLIAELNHLYSAAVRGEAEPLDALPLHYADYAEWQREVLAGAALQGQLDYWLAHLRGVPPLHALRTDHPRPPVFSFRGAAVESSLDKALTGRLQALARRGNATLFMLLQAAFAALLARHSGSRDIVFGTPVANREHPGIAALIGCFINVLVLRCDVADELDFDGLLAQVRQRFIDAMAQQQLPFEVLVEHAQPPRSLAHAPLFQVALVFQNNQTGEFELPGLTARALEPQVRSTKYDLTLVAKETGEGLRLSWEYASDLFEAATIRRLAANFERLLQAVLAAPHTPLAQLDCLDTDERRQLLQWGRGAVPAADDGASVVRCFEAQAAAAPERTALVFQDETLSYAALNARANRIAHWLAAQGAGAESLVAVCLERSADLVAALLGVLKAGAAYLPLDPHYPPARLQHMLQDSGARHAITARAQLPLLPSQDLELLCLDAAGAQETLAAQPAVDRAAAPAPQDLAYVIYTSGSTGLPKGVQIEHASMAAFLRAVRAVPGFGAGDSLLAVTPVSFDIHVLELFLPLVSGGSVVLCTREDAADGARLAALLRQHRIRVMQATPATWRLLLAADWQGEAELTVLCGGEALDRALADQLLPRVAALWNMYGPTEATVWASCARVGAGAQPVRIGAPLAHAQLHVLNAHGALQPLGAVGEIAIGGAAVARGYLGRDELTRERFVAVPALDGARCYRSGDLGYWTADGELVCLGRSDGQVKIRGFRIELGEIEQQLLQLDGIAQAVVAGDGEGDERRLVGYVVSAAGRDETDLAARLRRELARQLPEYMIPTLFVVLDELPLTPNGKVDRKALVAPAATAAAYVAPASATEHAVAAVLAELLRSEPVSVEGDFFALGGHSLLGARLVTLLNQRLGCSLSLKDVFEQRTARGLALHIDYLNLLHAQQHAPSPQDAALQEEMEW